MPQDNKILKWFKKKEAANSWVVILFTKPKLYLHNLVKRTVITGIVMFFFYETLKYIGVNSQAIPSTLHSLIGIVIGLLLVFRTNTAYDRWWEARKIFASLHATFLYFASKVKTAEKRTEILYSLRKMNSSIFDFVSVDTLQESEPCKDSFLEHHGKLSEAIYCEQIAGPIYSSIERKLSEMLDQFTALERIKNTPIPISYTFHIKLSIFLYLMSLPFGVFFELGVWSIPFVMILFFIIGGIEIISNEIENPFKGDPNDLPIEDYKKENEKYLI